MIEPKENLIADAVVDAVRKHLPYGAVDNVYWGAMWQEIRREARSHLSATLAAAQERESRLREALERADGMLKSLGQMDLHSVTLRTISGIREQIRAALSQPSQAPAQGESANLEPHARRICERVGLDPDCPAAPHGQWPIWYDVAGLLAAVLESPPAAPKEHDHD